MRSDAPRPDLPLEEQLRALGRQLDAAAPPVAPDELAEAAPEVAHLAAVDPELADVVPLVPLSRVEDPAGPRRRRRRVLGAAAAVAVLAGGAALALAPGGEEVRTDRDGLAGIQPASEGDGTELGGVDLDDLGGFGDVAEAFVACMEDAGFSAPDPADDAPVEPGSLEEAVADLTDPALLDAVRDCTARSGLADLDVVGELEALDVEGFLAEHFGDDDPVPGLFDDLLEQLGDIDMGEVTAELDGWLAEVQAQLEAAGVRDRLIEAGARADRLYACMEARGYTAEDLPDLAAGLDEGETIEQLLTDLRECADQG